MLIAFVDTFASSKPEQSLLSWFNEEIVGDTASQEAARRVLGELAMFYVLVVLGFGFLWITWRSNARIRHVRDEMSALLNAQKEAKFESMDAKMYF